MDEQRLRSLIDVGRSLVSELDPEAVLRRMLEVARDLTGARYAALGILDANRREVEQFLVVGIDNETRLAIGDPPRGRGVLGVLIEDPRPLRLEDVGDHPSSYGFPTGHPRMKSFLGVPVMIRGRAWGNLYLTEKDGGAFTADDEEAIVILAAWAAIAIENARVYKAVEAHRDDLERAVRALEATTDIARAVGGETELGRVLELIVKRGRALVGARTVVIMLEDAGELVVTATAGEAETGLVGFRIPIEGSLCGEVMVSGRPERLASASSRLRFVLHDRVGAETGLLVPLTFRGRPLGVLSAFDRAGAHPDFGMEDQRLLLSFAASAATAVATAKSVERERLRERIDVSEQERRRWARELHDQTLQGLGGLRVLLSSALRSDVPEALSAAAEQGLLAITGEIENLQSIITDLRPAALDQIGPKAAIEGIAEHAAAEGLRVSADIDLDYEAGRAAERHPPELEATLYRLVQEAANNALKHAGATRLAIAVHEGDGVLEVDVRDDGAGFEIEMSGGGFGLIGMRERVALVGGQLEIESAPGRGTTVHATLPTQPGRAVPRGLPASERRAAGQ